MTTIKETQPTLLNTFSQLAPPTS